MSAGGLPGASDECLVPAQMEGEGAPFFIVHGMYCEAAFAVLLAKALGRRHPVYGLRAVGLDGSSTPLKKIEAMAARYIESVRRVHPCGPYVLGGFCAGGHIAMTMAHQLIDAGERVERLFLIDTPTAVDPHELDAAIQRSIEAVGKLASNPRTRGRLSGAPATVAAFGEALKAYAGRPYPGSVVILASEGRLSSMQDPQHGWPRFVPAGTPIRIVAPSHEKIVAERMDVVAHIIREELAASGSLAEGARAGIADLPCRSGDRDVGSP